MLRLLVRGALFFVYAAQFLRPSSEVTVLSSPPLNRAEHLLIHRIQSHTNPKRRKGFLKQAGQKSSKEELPKQRKGPKRAEECRLKVTTHIWDQETGRSSRPTRTKIPLKSTISEGFFLFFVYCGAIGENIVRILIEFSVFCCIMKLKMRKGSML